MKRVFFDRFGERPNSTISQIWSPDQPGLKLFALERAWMHNRSNISCIPAGVYVLTPWESPRFGEVYTFIGGSVTPFDRDVPKLAGRWGNHLHAANSWDDLNGCAAPGFKYEERSGDYYIPPPSKQALSTFREKMGYEPMVAYVRWVVGVG